MAKPIDSLKLTRVQLIGLKLMMMLLIPVLMLM